MLPRRLSSNGFPWTKVRLLLLLDGRWNHCSDYDDVLHLWFDSQRHVTRIVNVLCQTNRLPVSVEFVIANKFCLQLFFRGVNRSRRQINRRNIKGLWPVLCKLIPLRSFLQTKSHVTASAYVLKSEKTIRISAIRITVFTISLHN